MLIHLQFCDCFTTFISVNQGIGHDRTAAYNRLKKGASEQGNLFTQPYKLQ